MISKSSYIYIYIHIYIYIYIWPYTTIAGWGVHLTNARNSGLNPKTTGGDHFGCLGSLNRNFGFEDCRIWVEAILVLALDVEASRPQGNR